MKLTKTLLALLVGIFLCCNSFASASPEDSAEAAYRSLKLALYEQVDRGAIDDQAVGNFLHSTRGMLAEGALSADHVGSARSSIDQALALMGLDETPRQGIRELAVAWLVRLSAATQEPQTTEEN